MGFLSSFVRRHFEGKPIVTSRNVGCFLRLEFERLLPKRRSRDKSTLNNALILSPLYFITGKHKLQIMLSNRVSVSTKTPHVSKFTICFISITIRLLPTSIHSLIYDNTPSHNSPICITPSPSPPPLPPPPINPTAMATPYAKDYPVWASIHGLFLFNDCISWPPGYY